MPILLTSIDMNLLKCRTETPCHRVAQVFMMNLDIRHILVWWARTKPAIGLMRSTIFLILVQTWCRTVMWWVKIVHRPFIDRSCQTKIIRSAITIKKDSMAKNRKYTRLLRFKTLEQWANRHQGKKMKTWCFQTKSAFDAVTTAKMRKMSQKQKAQAKEGLKTSMQTRT